MTTVIDIKPLTNELPSHFADRVGQLYAKTVTTQHKKDKGQFFTPTEIAHFMAGLTKQKFLTQVAERPFFHVHLLRYLQNRMTT